MLFMAPFQTHILSVNAEVAKCVSILYLKFLIAEQLGAGAQLFALFYFHLFLARKAHYKLKNIHLGLKKIHIG